MLNSKVRCCPAAFTVLSITLLLLAGLFAAENSARAEDRTIVYRTEDEQGRPMFSDRGAADAQKIKVRETMTFPAGAFKKPDSSFPYVGIQSKPSKIQHEYDTLVIRQPQDDAAIRSNSGNVTVEADLSPSLYPNHRLQLVMDQQVYATNQGAVFKLLNLDRGVHVLRLQIVDVDDDRVIKASEPISISILRPSVLHPARKGG